MFPLKQFSLLVLLALTIAGLVSFNSLQSFTELRSVHRQTEQPHPLVRDVRIIPGPPAHRNLVSEKAASQGTSHVRIAGKSLQNEKCLMCHFSKQSPEAAHLGQYLERHNPEIFGCQLCHGGNSETTVKIAAHAANGKFPFLRGHEVEANCGKCHNEPAVPGAPNLSGGRFVLNKYGCVTCHDLAIETPSKRYAPSLDYIGNKVSKQWLDKWLADPTGYLPDSKMPKIEMSKHERNAIVEFLTTQKNDTLLHSIGGRGNAKSGRQIFVDYQCQSCHTLLGEGTAFAPDLERIAIKTNRSWLVNYLKGPASLHPGSIMPDYNLTDQQALDLTEFLITNSPSLPQEPSISSPRKSKYMVAKGLRLYISKGCAQCHSIEKYREPEVARFLNKWDEDTAVERIRAHKVNASGGSSLEIPESDLKLMGIALSALRRTRDYEQLSYKLENGSLGNADEFLQQFWQSPIPLQKPPPSYYNATVSQLTPNACGTCHQEQWKDWQSTRHALSMGPGARGQLLGNDPSFVQGCQQCHAPLSEQLKNLPTSADNFATNKKFDSQLQMHGLLCAVCHVRDHQRFGPPFSDEGASASIFAKGHHGGAVVSSAFEDSRFCRPCHQFNEGDFSLNGKLLENTYNEWLESPQAQEGVTCQSCHMPNRRHQWKGIHDPETVIRSLKLSVEFISVQYGNLEAEIRLTNEGAGHHLPTYATPAIFVTARLLDVKNRPIAGTEEVRVVQRRVSLEPDDSREIFDTRIPAGGSWVYDYRSKPTKRAAVLEVLLDVSPDHFYNGFFKEYKAASTEAQSLIRKALETTEKSPYHLLTKQFPVVEK